MKPKILTLSEMWELYKILKLGLVGRPSESFMVDEVITIMEKIDTDSFKKSIKIMYGDKINYLEKSPKEIGLMFFNGIKYNKVLEFYDSIRILNSGNPKR